MSEAYKGIQFTKMSHDVSGLLSHDYHVTLLEIDFAPHSMDDCYHCNS